MDHGLIKLSSASRPFPRPLRQPLLNVLPILVKMLVDHLLGLISLRHRGHDLLLLLLLRLVLRELSLLLMPCRLHEIPLILFLLLVQGLLHCSDLLYRGGRDCSTITVRRALLPLGGKLEAFLDLRRVHQLVQLGLVVLLPVHLLSGVVVLHGLRVQVHQVLDVLRRREAQPLLNLHLELQHAPREVNGQVLLLEMVDVRPLLLLQLLLLLEFEVEALEVDRSFGSTADLFQLIVCILDLPEQLMGLCTRLALVIEADHDELVVLAVVQHVTIEGVDAGAAGLGTQLVLQPFHYYCYRI